MNTHVSKAVVAALAVGALLGGFAVYVINQSEPSHNHHENHGATKSTSSPDKSPLYWVAPMDPSYRRDGPGKSPMGMDLVPVYDEQDEAGVVTVSAAIENSLSVATAKVERKPMHDTLSVAAILSYDQERIVHIHPRLAGWVETLYVKSVGEQVTKNQPLYRLYSPELVNAQQEYLLAVSRKDPSLERAATNKLLSLQLTKPFITELKRSQKVSDRVVFYAPQSGVLDGLKIREGYYVEPGTTLMSIANLDEVWVSIQWPASQLAQINAGQHAMIHVAGEQTPRHGAIDYVYPQVDPVTRTVNARIRLENTDQTLKPNTFVQVDVMNHDSTPTLVVPEQAVIRLGKENRVVKALGDGRFKSVDIEIGRVAAGFVEVLSGLSESELIVTSSHFLLDSESNKAIALEKLDAKEVHESEVDHSQMNHSHMHHSKPDKPQEENHHDHSHH